MILPSRPNVRREQYGFMRSTRFGGDFQNWQQRASSRSKAGTSRRLWASPCLNEPMTLCSSSWDGSPGLRKSTCGYTLVKPAPRYDLFESSERSVGAARSRQSLSTTRWDSCTTLMRPQGYGNITPIQTILTPAENSHCLAQPVTWAIARAWLSTPLVLKPVTSYPQTRSLAGAGTSFTAEKAISHDRLAFSKVLPMRPMESRSLPASLSR